MSIYRRIESVATFVGTAALVALTVLLLWSGIGYLLYASELYQRSPEGRYMSYGWALVSGILVTYAVVVGFMAIAVAKLPSHRATLLLVTGALTSAIGAWAVASNFTGAFGVALRLSVVAGLCALAASVVLYGLRLRDKGDL